MNEQVNGMVKSQKIVKVGGIRAPRHGGHYRLVVSKRPVLGASQVIDGKRGFTA